VWVEYDMSKIPISVTILTKNSEQFIEEVLDSLKKFDEVVVVDNGSTDATILLSKKYENVTMCLEEFIGFGPLKRKAAQLAKHDWIFSVDSDEVVGDDLVDSIANIDLSSRELVYSINRRNFFSGREIKHSGWSPDILVRLFNKTYTNYNSSYVHEKVVLPKDCQPALLSGSFKHYSMGSVGEIVSKMNSYTTMYAESNRDRESSALKAVVHACLAFMKAYFIRLGFLDGWRGLVIAVMAANGCFVKYMKIVDLQERQSP
jgi:glycosyltransferase involved in cell wall biosynthesis